MRIGIPNEVKQGEARIAATPALVSQLLAAGHEVVIESNAGALVGYPDEAYVGAEIVATPKEVYSCPFIVKVKEPQPQEYELLREGQTLFCFLHLAASKELTLELMERKVTAIAFESITDSEGRFPLLHPMSEIAGRVAAQMGVVSLQMGHGGRGVLLPALGDLPAQKAVVIGGGVVGQAAARSLLGLGARLTLLDLKKIPGFETRISSPEAIAEEVQDAALVIGAVLVPGRAPPHVITEEMVRSMRSGSVIVDVAIDQGGCCATSRPTTHQDPTYIVHDTVHCCVANLPAACALTATEALASVLANYLPTLVEQGWQAYPEAVNTHAGACTYAPVAQTHDLSYTHISE